MMMMIWKLTPIDVESNEWQYSTHKDIAIVRAKNEEQARSLANGAFAMPNEHVPGAETRHMIWGQSDLVTCETIDDWDGETDGPVEVLYPVDNAVADRRREAQYIRALAYLAKHRTTDLQSLSGRIHRHLLSQACTEAKQRVEVDTHITDWARETGDHDLLRKIEPGLRKIADELERQAAVV